MIRTYKALTPKSKKAGMISLRLPGRNYSNVRVLPWMAGTVAGVTIFVYFLPQLLDPNTLGTLKFIATVMFLATVICAAKAIFNINAAKNEQASIDRMWDNWTQDRLKPFLFDKYGVKDLTEEELNTVASQAPVNVIYRKKPRLVVLIEQEGSLVLADASAYEIKTDSLNETDLAG